MLGDRAGVRTTGLETATQYLKDNRLLPRGFDKSTASPDIAVAGDAAQDANFTGDGDRVRFEVPVRMSTGSPLRVEVELRYQAIGYRWAHNLEAYKAAEPQRFLSYYQATVADSSVVVASASYLLPMTN